MFISLEFKFVSLVKWDWNMAVYNTKCSYCFMLRLTIHVAPLWKFVLNTLCRLPRSKCKLMHVMFVKMCWNRCFVNRDSRGNSTCSIHLTNSRCVLSLESTDIIYWLHYFQLNAKGTFELLDPNLVGENGQKFTCPQFNFFCIQSNFFPS